MLPGTAAARLSPLALAVQVTLGPLILQWQQLPSPDQPEAQVRAHVNQEKPTDHCTTSSKVTT
jgi:hypothetical protein